MRLIEIVTDAHHADTLAGIAEYHEVADAWWSGDDPDGRISFRMLVADDSRQKVLDALQSLLGVSESYRILVLPVDATLPRPPKEPDEIASRPAAATTREEIYDRIAKGGQLDSTFVLLTLLSTLVAAIGLSEDNVAVVIGAMVIAPLLGPNIALAFATSLGDRDLMWAAATQSRRPAPPCCWR